MRKMTDVLGFQEYTEKLQQMPKIRLLDLFQKRYLHSVIVSIFPSHYPADSTRSYIA